MIRRLFRRLKKAPQKADLVPVVFANGVDDDSYGIAEYLSGGRVFYLDRIYSRKNTLLIRGRKLRLKRGVIIKTSQGHIDLASSDDPLRPVVVSGPKMILDHCEIDVRAAP